MIVLRTLCANAAGRLTDTAVADLRTHCVLAAAACASVQGLLQHFRVCCFENRKQWLKCSVERERVSAYRRLCQIWVLRKMAKRNLVQRRKKRRKRLRKRKNSNREWRGEWRRRRGAPAGRWSGSPVSVSRFVAFVKLVLNCNNWNIDVLVGPFSSYHLGFEMRLTCTLVLIIPQK